MSFEVVSLETIQAAAHEYGYWTVFGGIMLENAGIPLPGETITLVGGFLAGNGELDYWLVLGCTIAGAILGDNFGYWIGRYGGWPFLLKLGKIFRVEEHQLEEVKTLFTKNAVRAVFLGRFVALLRIFAGPLAGIAEMPYSQFFLCNAAGAAIWASVMVSFAFFVGQIIPLEQLISWVAQFTMLAFLIVIIWIGISMWLESRQKEQT